MTTEEKKEFMIVVSVGGVVSLLVLASLIHKFNIYDFGYLIVCLVSLLRYVKVKTM